MTDGTDHGSQAPNPASAFYCNANALSSAERARHQSVTRSLLLSVKEVKELSDGFALRFCADKPSITLVSEFMSRERLCYPFLKFTVGVEPQGGPLWLYLRGEEGVKELIKVEVGLPDEQFSSNDLQPSPKLTSQLQKSGDVDHVIGGNRLTSAQSKSELPRWLFAIGFCISLLLAIACLTIASYYLYRFQATAQAGISPALSSAKDSSEGTRIIALTAELYVARIHLSSCGIMVGMAFGFLGFALFLLGLKTDMDAEGGHGDFKVKFARLTPGTFIIVSAMVLIGYCALRTLPFDYREIVSGKEQNDTRPSQQLPDDNKANEILKKPL